MKRKTPDFEMLAINAARVLSKFGTANATYDEWVYLKDELLSLQKHMSPPTSCYVGTACSVFIEAHRNQSQPRD